MPTVKGSEVSVSYVQCFLYLVSSSINVSGFHSASLDTFWTDLTNRPGRASFHHMKIEQKDESPSVN